MQLLFLAFLFVSIIISSDAFGSFSATRLVSHTSNGWATSAQQQRTRGNTLQMNFFEDAFRYFSQLGKEASAKHILIKGPNGIKRCEDLKAELSSAEDLNVAFSEFAAKYSECPSASRGGNLGTFKPGMMVKEFDQVCFAEEVGKVHGPVQTQFGSHLILITRRYEGEKK